MLNILFAFLAGVMVIISMIINSHLSKEIGVFQGAFVNFIVGLTVAIIVFILTKSYSNNYNSCFNGIPMWAYFGGALGVIIVAISNVIIPKIPAIYITLLIFTGQLFSGIIIDYFRQGVVSKGKIIGGIIILIGMIFNFFVDRTETEVNKHNVA